MPAPRETPAPGDRTGRRDGLRSTFHLRRSPWGLIQPSSASACNARPSVGTLTPRSWASRLIDGIRSPKRPAARSAS
ncbi:MAG: hypothetical protein KDN05_13375, partial [Verrucomicrobiae bacterium]|nr:hypothetical protein [Verrucomicrobiae bacterium]